MKIVIQICEIQNGQLTSMLNSSIELQKKISSFSPSF